MKIVKIGTQVLTTDSGQLDLNRLRAIVYDVAAYIEASGKPVVLVSSGSITSGAEALGISPQSIPEEQAAAAVGQILLTQEYAQFFKLAGIRIAQILLTRDAFEDEVKRTNAKNTLMALLERGIVPIINENDTISTEEIKFGDNDHLSSLVATLLEAENLLLLTNTDGVYTADPSLDNGANRIDKIADISTFDIEHFATGPMSKRSRGGMRSKLLAAKHAAEHGITVTIANGRTDNIICDSFSKKAIGTTILPVSERTSL